MQLVHALTAVLALGASAAPHAEPDTSSVQDVEARNYKCGRDAYWKDNCCQCRVEGMVYHKAWGGCNYPNRKADKHHGCKGDSYYDYHRDCCACSNNKYYYFSVEETCGSCGPEAYYDYDHNKCKCKHKHHHWDEHHKGCRRD